MLTTAFTADAKLESAFNDPTLGKRREYADYIAQAKRPEALQKRLTKITPMILSGAGLNERYKSKPK